MIHSVELVRPLQDGPHGSIHLAREPVECECVNLFVVFVNGENCVLRESCSVDGDKFSVDGSFITCDDRANQTATDLHLICPRFCICVTVRFVFDFIRSVNALLRAILSRYRSRFGKGHVKILVA